MTLTITAQDIQELIRVINCFGGDDYEAVFGRDYEHYIAKRQNLGLGGFICYLDSGNIERVMAHAKAKMDAFRERQG